MPYKRTKTSYRRRKPASTTRKVVKSRTRTRRTGAPRLTGPFNAYSSMDPFKPSFSCKLRYSESLTLSSGTGTQFGSEEIFRLNSLFDPNYIGGGHQPYGFDQVAALYKRYKVTGCLVDIVFTDPSADGCVVATQLQTPGEPYTLAGKIPGDVKEQPMSVTRSVNNTGKQLVKVRQYVPIGSVSGLTALQFRADADNFTADVTANPLASPLIRFALANDRSTASTIVARITLTYYSRFIYRKIQALS